MNNKEILQSNNAKLKTNNTSLDNILSSINELPNRQEVSLQDKSITITENGTQNIVADDGYDGLGNVEVSVNVEGSGGGKYAPRYISFYNYNGTSLKDELDNLDTSNISDMSDMFYGCSKVTELDVSNFNTSQLNGTRSMFYGCSSLTKINFGNFDASEVTTLQEMFRNCTSLVELDLSTFISKKATTTRYMFGGCSKLEKLNLSGIDTSNMLSGTYTFNGCTSLKTLIIDNPVMFKITNVNAFTNSGITSGICTIYVPKGLIETYKADTYWGVYANQIKSIT